MNNIVFKAVVGLIVSIVAINTSAQDTRIEIQRFDKDFFQYLEKGSKTEEQKLSKKYPDLLPAFYQIAQTGSKGNVGIGEVKKYFEHPMLKSIYKDEVRILSDLTDGEKNLAKAVKLARDYFPNTKFPRLAIHVSGFKENVIVLDSLISISGDKYLGKDYKNYTQFFSERERYCMEPKAIARDLLKAWILSGQIIKKEKADNLTSAMIYEGKVLFLLSKLLPDYTNEEIALFSPSDMKLFEQNKAEIWNRMIKEKLLFSENPMTIASFLDENPHSLPVTGKTPPQTGVMFGWEIVIQYAKQVNVPLEDLLKTDAVTILKTVRYTP